MTQPHMSPSPSRSTAGEEHLLPPIGIAVMGATGSGKSSFINIASGSQLRVGKSLKSCTAEVEVANAFTLDGRRVFLIDTPGFDDTTVSDAQILEKIAAFLAATYKEGSKLAGILYLHRISDDRFTGASVRNFKMFRKLCGDSTLKNVILVTNMWGRIEKDVGEAHEKELAAVYFKPALDRSAQLTRHHNTAQSAHEVIRRIMKNNPAPLRIQQELVDEGKNIKETAAGEAVNEEMNALLRNHEAEMKSLRQEMARALKEKDELLKAELEKETRRVTTLLNKVKTDSAVMSAKYNEERKKMEGSLQDMRKRAEADRKRAEESHRKQIDGLKTQLQKNNTSSAGERKALQERISGLERQLNNSRSSGGRGCTIM